MPAKTDLNFTLSVLNNTNKDNIKFIINTLKSVNYTIGSKGAPTVADLCSALEESQKIHKEATEIANNPNQENAFDAVKALSEKAAEVKANTVDVMRSKSYAFYLPSELEALGDNAKKLEEIKIKNLENLEAAYKLNLTPGLEKTIESIIKTNQALAIMPMAKNGPDQARILAELEQLVGMTTKTIQQEAFRQQIKEEPDRDLHTKEPQVTLEAAEDQPEA